MLATLGFPSMSAQRDPCTGIEKDAVKARNWDSVYRTYKRYEGCENVAAGEGFSEAVARILVDQWSTLPRVAKLGARNADFRRFVLGCINATLDMKDVERIKALANSSCPRRLDAVCRDLVRQADAAFEEDRHYREKKE